jgi:hypothetical protein
MRPPGDDAKRIVLTTPCIWSRRLGWGHLGTETTGPPAEKEFKRVAAQAGLGDDRL